VPRARRPSRRSGGRRSKAGILCSFRLSDAAPRGNDRRFLLAQAVHRLLIQLQVRLRQRAAADRGAARSRSRFAWAVICAPDPRDAAAAGSARRIVHGPPSPPSQHFRPRSRPARFDRDLIHDPPAFAVRRCSPALSRLHRNARSNSGESRRWTFVR
jgi:hypothetical protein